MSAYAPLPWGRTGVATTDTTRTLTQPIFQLLTDAALCTHRIQSHIAGTTIVELGSGCGLVSICAVALGAHRVVATDTADALDLPMINADATLESDGGERGRLRVLPLQWGSDADVRCVLAQKQSVGELSLVVARFLRSCVSFTAVCVQHECMWPLTRLEGSAGA